MPIHALQCHDDKHLRRPVSASKGKKTCSGLGSITDASIASLTGVLVKAGLEGPQADSISSHGSFEGIKFFGNSAVRKSV